ncbi:hypothetical protein NDN08_002478 [Rhodosorus marinus]|uniref:Trafficking protein particle complex subunit 11 domain-containing protein n=1 Tax=Rhodosorus marinus TaxID=101924 RepID=A0AAV8UY28_9RHOD|nr:hypothetical protein NDN08_002478 [Rhodosorus marinus]
MSSAQEREDRQAGRGLAIRVSDDGNAGSRVQLPATFETSVAWRNAEGAVIKAENVTFLFNDLRGDIVDGIAENLRRQPSATGLKRPYVQLFFFSKLSDDAFKDKGSRISEFVESCTDRSTEWLVAYVSRQGAEESKANKATLEKFRITLGLTRGGKDRLLVLYVNATATLESVSWEELSLRLRESLNISIQLKIESLKKEAAQAHANRLLPGWSFCSYVHAYVPQAELFVQLNRLDLALVIFEELEQALIERKEGATTFFPADAGEFVANVIDPEAKSYRRMIASGTITELDLRTYLFSSRMKILMEQDRKVQVGEKGIKFLEFVQGRFKEEFEKTKSEYLRTLIDVLSGLIGPAGKEDGSEKATRRKTAKLIAFCCQHALDQFRAMAEASIPDLFDGMSIVESIPKSAEVARLIQHPELQGALESRESAWELYTEMTMQTAEVFRAAGRSSFADRMQIQLGQLCLEKGFEKQAVELLASHCHQFSAKGGWDLLHNEIRSRVADLERRLNLKQDYLLSALAAVTISGSDQLVLDMGENAFSEDSQKWVKEATKAASELPEEMKFDLRKLFSVQIQPQAEIWTAGEQASVVITFRSRVQVEMSFTSLVVEMRGAAEEERISTAVLMFTNPGPLHLKPGTTSVLASTQQVASAGWFKLYTVSMSLEKLRLWENFESGVRGRTPSNLLFQSVGSTPLEVSVEDAEDLPLINGSENSARVSFVAGNSGYDGTVEMHVKLNTPESLRRDVQAGIHLMDKDGSECVSVSERVDLQLEPSAAYSVQVPFRVDQVVPRYMLESSLERKVFQAELEVKATLSFSHGGMPRVISRQMSKVLEFVRPLKFIARLESVSPDSSLLSIAILNEMKQAELGILNAELKITGKKWLIDRTERPPHGDLLQQKIQPASTFHTVFPVKRSADTSGPDEESLVSISVEVQAAGGDRASQFSEGVCNLEALVKEAKSFLVRRSVEGNAVVGSRVKFEFTVEPILESSKNSLAQELLLYEIKHDPKEWVVAGKQRGKVVAEKKNIVRHIIPLRSGLLSPPKIMMVEAPVAEDPYVFSVDHADQILQVHVLPAQYSRITCEEGVRRQLPTSSGSWRPGADSFGLSNNDLMVEKL